MSVLACFFTSSIWGLLLKMVSLVRLAKKFSLDRKNGRFGYIAIGRGVQIGKEGDVMKILNFAIRCKKGSFLNGVG